MVPNSTLRGMFHVMPAVAGVLLIHVARVPDEVISTVLLWATAFVFGFLDLLRIYVAKRDKEDRIDNFVLRGLNWLRNRGEPIAIRIGFLRKTERFALSTAGPYIAGIYATWWCFGTQVALIALIILGAGDPMARYFGTRIPCYRFKNPLFDGKSLGGFTAFFFCAFIGVHTHFLFNVFFPDYQVFPLTHAWFIAMLVGVLVGAGVELVSGFWDNFAVQFVPGAAMKLVFVLA